MVVEVVVTDRGLVGISDVDVVYYVVGGDIMLCKLPLFITMSSYYKVKKNTASNS